MTVREGWGLEAPPRFGKPEGIITFYFMILPIFCTWRQSLEDLSSFSLDPSQNFPGLPFTESQLCMSSVIGDVLLTLPMTLPVGVISIPDDGSARPAHVSTGHRS